MVLASVSLGAGVGLIFPVLAEFQDRYGFSALGLGLISAASFVSALVSGLLLAQLADRGRARMLLVGGLVLSALGLLWFAAGSELWHFVGARVLEGFGAGVYFPAARRVVTADDPASAGHELGVLAAAEHGGFLLGPAVGAVLAQAVSLPAPFLAIGATQLVLAGWVAVVRLPGVPSRRRDRPRGRSPGRWCSPDGPRWPARRCCAWRCSSPSGCTTPCGRGT